VTSQEIAELIAELERVRATSTDPDACAHLGARIRILRAALRYRGTHTPAEAAGVALAGSHEATPQLSPAELAHLRHFIVPIPGLTPERSK
jgi:hypothetical protein